MTAGKLLDQAKALQAIVQAACDSPRRVRRPILRDE
jgi:hypothetical protein